MPDGTTRYQRHNAPVHIRKTREQSERGDRGEQLLSHEKRRAKSAIDVGGEGVANAQGDTLPR